MAIGSAAVDSCPPPLLQCLFTLKEPPMPIPKDLLDILVCPACKAPVKPTPDNSGLKCQSCRRVYPVRDEIPVMLVEEATIAPE
jgi:uncharacterized protein YbaR (Trm112 family)